MPTSDQHTSLYSVLSSFIIEYHPKNELSQYTIMAYTTRKYVKL
jgi:hypothetical protein